MAKIVFKSYNPNDNLLLPPCLGDYLPQNHPARVVSAIIDRLDISEIESGYVGGGTSSYNPRMLLKVIVYAYSFHVAQRDADPGLQDHQHLPEQASCREVRRNLHADSAPSS